jgi:hypothetical protein
MNPDARPVIVVNRPKEDEMGRIVVTEFVSLDGVMEDPGGAEGFEHGGEAEGGDRRRDPRLRAGE